LLAPEGQATGGAGAAVNGGGAGGATAGAGDCAGSGRAGGGVCDDLATHWPFLKSCHGKQPLSVAILRLPSACAGLVMEKPKQIKIAVAAKMRVMEKPRRHPLKKGPNWS
jgi:hypothetical protein